jgi:hypothetical protein
LSNVNCMLIPDESIGQQILGYRAAQATAGL